MPSIVVNLTSLTSLSISKERGIGLNELYRNQSSKRVMTPPTKTEQSPQESPCFVYLNPVVATC